LLLGLLSPKREEEEEEDKEEEEERKEMRLSVCLSQTLLLFLFSKPYIYETLN